MNQIQKKLKHSTKEKQGGEDYTKATLPIQGNVVLVREGGQKVEKKFGVFFTSTSPRHPVID